MRGRPRILPIGPKGEAANATSPEVTIGIAVESWTSILDELPDNPTLVRDAIGDWPGSVIRDILRTWSIGQLKGEVESFKAALNVYERELQILENGDSEAEKRNFVVPDLAGKLAGTRPATMLDIYRLLTVAIYFWKLTSGIVRSVDQDFEHDIIEMKRSQEMCLALLKVAVLETPTSIHATMRNELSRLFDNYEHFSNYNDKKSPANRWHLQLKDQTSSIGMDEVFSKGAKTGNCLIISTTDSIFIESDDYLSTKNFSYLANYFTREDEKGILIAIIDGGALRPGVDIDRHRIIYNVNLISAALSTFSTLGVHPEGQVEIDTIINNKKRWEIFRNRFCIILKNFRIIDEESGRDIKGQLIDEYIIDSGEPYDEISPLSEHASVDSNYILPSQFPKWVKQGLAKRPKHLSEDEDYHHWNVLIDRSNPHKIQTRYFIVPDQKVGTLAGRGGTSPTNDEFSHTITPGGPAYLIESQKPTSLAASENVDRAQDLIYRAACGRLKLGLGNRDDNLRAVAELRDVGYEVMPFGVALSLFLRPWSWGLR